MAFLLCDPGWCVHNSDVQNKWDDNREREREREIMNICYSYLEAIIVIILQGVDMHYTLL